MIVTKLHLFNSDNPHLPPAYHRQSTQGSKLNDGN